MKDAPKDTIVIPETDERDKETSAGTMPRVAYCAKNRVSIKI
jgi:hypothetical protein